MHAVASRPQNIKMMPRVAEIVKKVAGAFSQVDTIQDLDRDLSEIEAAVHKLYSQSQSLNDFAMFGRKNRG